MIKSRILRWEVTLDYLGGSMQLQKIGEGYSQRKGNVTVKGRGRSDGVTNQEMWTATRNWQKCRGDFS